MSSNVKSPHEQIAHVPQEIFVYDESFAKNVTLNEKIHEDKIWAVASDAILTSFIDKELVVISSALGERGNKLSGGQNKELA